MRKIVFHVNSLGQGGAQRVITTLANWFANEGYQVLIATEWTAEREFSIDKKIRRVQVGLTDKQKKAGQMKRFICRIKNLRTFLKNEKPDIVVAFATKENYRAILATLFTKIPVIISVRNNPFQHYTNFKDRLLTRLLFPRAEGNVFQTNEAKSFFTKKVQKCSRVILNPINEKYIGQPRPKTRRKAIVQSSSIVEYKNQMMLLEAFAQVHKKYPEYTLEIYGVDLGDGTKEMLEQKIEEYQLKQHVALVGGSDMLEKQLVDATVYAFSSNYEGLPNALMEAMALGLPVISTDCPCGGPRTLIQNGVNGLLVPIKDSKAMEESILKLIEDKKFAESLGEQARKIGEIANTPVICNQWKEYIEEICRSK